MWLVTNEAHVILFYSKLPQSERSELAWLSDVYYVACQMQSESRALVLASKLAIL